MPDFNARVTEQTVFQLWVEDIERAYDTMLADIRAEIVRMRLLGIDEAEIFARLKQNVTDDSGAFQSFNGWVEGATDKLTHAVAQTESNAVYSGTEENLTWELDPTAREHCADCLRNSQAPAMPFAQWAAIGIPGAGNTECDGYCKCTLSPEAQA